MNNGKIFERQWRKSAQDCKDLFYYRLKDSPTSWGQSEAIRFTNENICDVVMFKTPVLFLLELKAVSNKSLPYTNIRKNQFDGLLEASEVKNVRAGLVVYFHDLEECYFADIKSLDKFKRENDRKSFPVQFFRDSGMKIDIKSLRVNKLYGVSSFVEEALLAAEQ